MGLILSLAHDTTGNSLVPFSQNLFSEIYKLNRNENIIFSSFSIESCLAMVRMGAAGKTAAEMDQCLNFTRQTADSVADNYHNLLAKYEKEQTVIVANKVYVKENYELQDNFHKVLSEKFLSAPENIDFTKANQAAEYINNWVEAKTNNKIKDFVTPNILSPNTRMALVSTIHFKGEWRTQFPEENTSDMDFYIDENHSIKVPTMYHTYFPDYAHLDDLTSQALRLQYKNSDLSMLIILPKARTGLNSLVEKLQNVPLQSLKSQFRRKHVRLFLPKFEAEFYVDLKQPLKSVSSENCNVLIFCYRYKV